MKEIHKKKKYMTVPEALRELDKIELIRQIDGTCRLDHAVTATQKDILQAFNLTAAGVEKEAKVLGKGMGGLRIKEERTIMARRQLDIKFRLGYGY